MAKKEKTIWERYLEMEPKKQAAIDIMALMTKNRLEDPAEVTRVLESFTDDEKEVMMVFVSFAEKERKKHETAQ